MTVRMKPAPIERPPTILIVEDDAAIAQVLHRLFKLEGFGCVSADTGAEALDLVAASAADLVVLDLMLPDMSGYEVCARLRKPDAAPIPIVMLTAMGRQDQVVRGLELGADDYLVKPFDPHELVLRVAGLFRRSEAALTAERERSAWQAAINHTRATADAAHVDAAAARSDAVAARSDAVAARSDAQVERMLRGEVMHNVTTHMRTLGNVADVAVRRFPVGPLREVADQLRQRIRGAAVVYELSEALQHDPADVGEVVRIITRGLKAVYRPSRRVVAEVTGPPLAFHPRWRHHWR